MVKFSPCEENIFHIKFVRIFIISISNITEQLEKRFISQQMESSANTVPFRPADDLLPTNKQVSHSPEICYHVTPQNPA
jgi:hypothetical protein